MQERKVAHLVSPTTASLMLTALCCTVRCYQHTLEACLAAAASTAASGAARAT